MLTVAVFAWKGLHLQWSGALTVELIFLAMLAGLWANLQFGPGSPRDREIADVLFVVLALLLFSAIASPLQYGLVALGSPYADPWLTAADAGLGINVSSLAAWTNTHLAIARILALAYQSFLPQLLLTVLALGFLRDRERLWEFAFHYYFCLIVALAAFAIWPAACPPAFLHFTSTLDISHLIGQIAAFHDGRARALRFEDLEGLISFPSFHAAMGLIVAWVFRNRPWIRNPLIVLNALLIAATFMTGVHYVIDIVAAVPLVALSLVAWRRWGRAVA